MADIRKDCRVDKRSLDDVCCDCQDFLSQVKVPCEKCPVDRLKLRIGH